MTTRVTLVLTSLLLVVAGCADPATNATPNPPGGNPTGVGGVVTAGPVCPVEKNPPDSGCAPRPVAGAVLAFSNAAGSEVARVTTAADGAYFAELPGGVYVVMPQPVEGLLGTPGPESVTVADGTAVVLDLSYDTGIR